MFIVIMKLRGIYSELVPSYCQQKRVFFAPVLQMLEYTQKLHNMYVLHNSKLTADELEQTGKPKLMT